MADRRYPFSISIYKDLEDWLREKAEELKLPSPNLAAVKVLESVKAEEEKREKK